jgi:hypothetical protein
MLSAIASMCAARFRYEVVHERPELPSVTDLLTPAEIKAERDRLGAERAQAEYHEQIRERDERMRNSPRGAVRLRTRAAAHRAGAQAGVRRLRGSFSTRGRW